MTLEIKICGITRLEDARYCAAAGADYLGFIQHPGSPRYIRTSAAKEIIDWVYGPKTVGVFVNRTAAEINAATREAGFVMAQLHGDESPDVCAAVDVPVIKVMRIASDTTSDEVAAFCDAYRDVVEYVLLDTRVDGLWGGSGETFAWDVARALGDEVPIFLAGGIRSSNVEAAVCNVGPHGLDVSSGLESSPGAKDFEKVDAFFDVVHRIRRNENASAARRH